MVAGECCNAFTSLACPYYSVLDQYPTACGNAIFGALTNLGYNTESIVNLCTYLFNVTLQEIPCPVAPPPALAPSTAMPPPQPSPSPSGGSRTSRGCMALLFTSLLVAFARLLSLPLHVHGGK
eukprot:TRINITY_DN4139_c0_g1_i2.p1 TRINITY_DN4139_c0_g1~~TRINITY_DN4139_c0_g1_i2.p1  ORF type:complete len:130 (-),score=22.36 TRINITY_DN4139_c0_g1_i2:253-621(-)